MSVHPHQSPSLSCCAGSWFKVVSCAVLSLAGLAGCAGPAPVVTVQGAYVVERGPAGTLVHVVVDARNPRSGDGADDQPLREAVYRAGASGAAMSGASGARSVRVVQATVGPGVTQRFELPVIVPPGQPPDRLDIDGSIEFVPSGTLRRLLADWLPLPTQRLRGRGVALAPSGPGLAPAAAYRVVTSVPVGAGGAAVTVPEVR